MIHLEHSQIYVPGTYSTVFNSTQTYQVMHNQADNKSEYQLHTLPHYHTEKSHIDSIITQQTP